MSLITTITKRNPVQVLPENTYPAILYRIIQLGKQPFTYQGVTRHKSKLLISFVIPSQTVLIENEYKPAIVHKEYTFSLDSWSLLYKDIIAMRGRDFDDSESGLEFDLTSLLGMPMLIKTRLKPGKNPGESYAQIDSIYELPEEDELPESPLEYQVLTFSQFNWPLFNSLNTRLRQRIESSPEFQAIPEREKVRGRTLVREEDIEKDMVDLGE